MANHDLVLGQSPDLALGQTHELVMRQNHGLDNVHHQGIDNKFDMENSHENDLVLGHHSHHHLLHESELALGQNHGSDDPNDLDVRNHELVMDENQRLSLTDPHELGIAEPLAVDHSQEMMLQSNQEMSIVEQAQFVSPLFHSQSIIIHPSHQVSVGQEFSDVKSCRRALRNAAIACHFEIQTVKSDKTRFTAKCASDGCPWRVHAAKLPGVPTFTIRTINETHTCNGVNHLGHQQASVEWVASSVEERLRENPLYKPKDILEEIHKIHGITLSYKQAWRGKERIMAAVRGSFEEGYRLLPKYCEQIRQTNPGSIALVVGNQDDGCFKRLFISFHASIYGFINACRPLIGLDRTLLKSKYLGTLFFATGFDGDGALFPIAFGVVAEENDENWIWFLSELHTLLVRNTENMPRLTILSDRQKGIVDGVDFNFPTAFHGFCMHHLSESFKKQFNNPTLLNLLWDAAYALTVIGFEAKILEIEEISQEAAFWIRRIPPRLWATAYFEGSRFGHLTANIAESLNNWILEASGLPIIQMLECIRRQLMTWFNERREASMQWIDVLVPSAEQRVSDALQQGQNLPVVRANEAEFEVISAMDQQPMIVDIRNRCCLCRGWQLYGLPCAHASAALLACRQNVHRFTESCFTVATYRKTYSQTIHPIPDKSLWKDHSDLNLLNGGDNQPEILINPPKSLKPPGRPRKKRVRSEDRGRVKRVVHCSRCNQTGHFRTTCAAPI